MDASLFLLGLYLLWYFLTRVIFRIALVYFYRVPFKKALAIFDADEFLTGADDIEMFLLHSPLLGDIGVVILVVQFLLRQKHLLENLPIPTPAKMDRALIRFAERRQLRLKNSDKVGLLTEVKR